MADTHEFFTRQHEHLNKIETSIVKTQTDLNAARTEALASLQAKREQAAAAGEARQEKIRSGITHMRTRMEAKKQETDAAIEGWKQKRELHKLESRARSAEDYAAAAMTVLDAAQEEARAASLEAIEARRVADEAKQAAGPAN
jgi:hypothetical protein